MFSILAPIEATEKCTAELQADSKAAEIHASEFEFIITIL
jgi:hypothetical protein